MTDPQKLFFAPEQGEALPIGPPSAGTVHIKSQAGGGHSAVFGTQTLQPGAEIPMQRHAKEEQWLLVYKGQGRAVLEGRRETLVPGALLHVPSQTWYGIRNTGTGTLQVAWVCMPAGIEQYYRELSKLSRGATVEVAALAQQYGIEFSAEPVGAPQPQGGPVQGGSERRRHRRRGGRGRHRGQREQLHQPPQGAAAGAPAETMIAGPAPVEAAAAGQAGQRPEGGHGRRRRRRGGRGRHQGQGGPQGRAPQQPQAPQAPHAPQAPAQTTTRAAKPSGGAPKKARGERSRRFFGRVREVFMGGKWVKVSGQGPVVSTGRDVEGKPDDDEG
jgi:quercetin dioxygenase-like cupin family protein